MIPIRTTTGRVPSLLERALALVLLAALVAGVAGGVVLPLAERARHAAAASAENYAVAERLARIASTGKDARATIEALEARIEKSALFLRAETEMLAQVALQDRLETIVDDEGADLGSVTALPARESDDFRRIRLRARFEAGYESVLRVLHRIETGTPALFVDRLRIEPASRRASMGSAIGEAPDRFSVGVDVYAYLPPEVSQ